MEIGPIGSIYELDLNKFSVNGLLLFLNSVRHAFVLDDNTEHGPKTYGARETPVWRAWSNALELVLAIKRAQEGSMIKIDAVGSIYLNPNEFSLNQVLLLHDSVRHALAIDDNTKDEPKPYGAREAPVWQELAYSLELVLEGKGAQFRAINWHP